MKELEDSLDKLRHHFRVITQMSKRGYESLINQSEKIDNEISDMLAKLKKEQHKSVDK